MSYITTSSGKHFDPVEPDEALLDIYDIAHSLSNICRANGHVRIFYSVAQHSIACSREAQARGLSRELVLGCLLHDGSEAYMSDVIRPLKKDMEHYLKTEDRLQHMIWRHFIGRELTAAEEKLIFEIDDEMLDMEFHQLMPEDISDGYRRLKRQFECVTQDAESVRAEFIGLYKEYAHA